MNFICNLAGETVQLSQGFKIFPPAEVTADPGILQRDEAATNLLGTTWWLRFADGREELLTFTELMVMIYQLIEVATQLRRHSASGTTGKVSVSLRLDVAKLMTAERVKAMLSKVSLEGIERAPEFVATFPVYGIRQGGNGGETPLLGIKHRATGMEMVFIFTELGHAGQFASRFGAGNPVKVAADNDAFKEVLRTGTGQIVAFDPFFNDNGELQVMYQIMVAAILAS